MKYSKTAIGLLTAQYRSVLKKCLLINLGLFALGAVAATPANAAATEPADVNDLTPAATDPLTWGDLFVLGNSTYGNYFQTKSGSSDGSYAEIWNETDGGGSLYFNKTANMKSYVGTSDGGTDGIAVQIYSKDVTTNSGTRLNVNPNGIYYTKGTNTSVDGGDPNNEIATAGSVAAAISGKADTAVLGDGFSATSTVASAIGAKLTGTSAAYSYSTTSTTAPADGAFYTASSIKGSLDKANTAIQGIKAGTTTIAPDDNGVVTLGTMATKTATNYSTKAEADELYAAKTIETTVSGHTTQIGGMSDSIANINNTLNGTEGNPGLISKVTTNANNITDLQGTVGNADGGLVKDVADLKSGKVDKVDGKGLSSNDYTNADKTKLAGIAAGAQVNTIEGIKVDNTIIAPDDDKIVTLGTMAVANAADYSTTAEANELYAAKSALNDYALKNNSVLTGVTNLQQMRLANKWKVYNFSTDTSDSFVIKDAAEANAMVFSNDPTVGLYISNNAKNYMQVKNGEAVFSDAGNPYLQVSKERLALSGQNGTYFASTPDYTRAFNADGDVTLGVTNNTGNVFAKGVIQSAGLTFTGGKTASAISADDADASDEKNVTLSTEAYVDASLGDVLNKTSETADGASMNLDNSSADFTVIGTDGNDEGGYYNFLRVSSNNAGIVLNARPTGTTGEGSTLEITNEGVYYNENEVVTYATAKDGVYTAAQGEDPQSPDYVPAVTIGEAIAGNTSAITTMNGLFEDDPEATTEGQKLSVAQSVAKGITASVEEAQEEGDTNGIVAEYVLGKGYQTAQDVEDAIGEAEIDGSQITAGTITHTQIASGGVYYDNLSQGIKNMFTANEQGIAKNKAAIAAHDALFEDDDTQGAEEGAKLSVAQSVEKGIRASVVEAQEEGDTNGIVAEYVLGKLTGGTQDIVAASLTLPTMAGETVGSQKIEYVEVVPEASEGNNVMATQASVHKVVGTLAIPVVSVEGPTEYRPVSVAEIIGVDANGTLGFGEDDRNVWYGNGNAETPKPDTLVQAIKNLDAALGPIHGLANEDGTVNDDTSIATPEHKTHLRAGSSGSEFFVDLDNAIIKIETGDIVAGKAKADQNGAVIDETYATKAEAMLKVDYLYEGTTDIDGAKIHNGTITWGKLGSGVQDWIRKIGDADFSSAVHEAVKNATQTIGTGASQRTLGDATKAILALDGLINGVESIVGTGVLTSAANTEIKTAADLTQAILGIDTLIGDFRTYNGPSEWSKVPALINADGETYPTTIAQAVYNLGKYVEDGVVTVENKAGVAAQEIKGAKKFSGNVELTKLIMGAANITSISTATISETPSENALVTEAAVANAITTAGAGYVKTTDIVTDYNPSATTSDTTIYSTTAIKTALATKQDTIEDLDKIEAGAALGATSVQGITGEGTGESGYLSITTDDDGHKLISAAKIAEANLTNELKEKIALTGKIGDLSALHEITNNAGGSKAENLVVAINNFDTALKKSVETKELNLNGKKVNEINTGTKIVDGVETSDVVTGNGSGSVLATTATVMTSAENAKFTAPTGENAVESIGTAGTINEAIVNVGKAVDEVEAKVGSADFTGAHNIHNIGDVKPTLTDAINQLDTAIGDVASITADYAKTNTESGSSNPADLATAIQNVATAAKEADGDLNFTEDFTKSVDGEGNPVSPTDLTTAINNVAKNAQDAVAGVAAEIHGDGTAGSTVEIGDKADAITIGKISDEGKLTGMQVRTTDIDTDGDGETEPKGLNIAVSGDGKSTNIDMTETEIQTSATNNGRTVGMLVTNNGDDTHTVSLGEDGKYTVEVDTDAGKTTFKSGTGDDAKKVEIGAGTITTDGDVTVGGNETVAGDLSAAGGNFTVVTTTEGEGDEATSTTTMRLTGDADISGDTSIGGGLDVAGDVTVGADGAQVVLSAEDGSITTDGDVTVGDEGTQVVLSAEDGSITADGDVTIGDEGTQVVLSAEDGSITADGDVTVGDEGTQVVLSAEDGSITADGNATIDGNLSATDGNFTVVTTTEGEGDEATSTTTMRLTGDADISGDTSIGGDLDVTGKTTLSAENGMAFGEGPTATAIDDGSEAQSIPAPAADEGDEAPDLNKSTLATVATVLKSAENATFSGATDENHATGTAETIKEAFQNIDTFVGSKEALTNKGISDKADLTTAFNSFADNVEAGMGGQFAEGGKWSADISNVADAPEDGYYSAFTAENLAGAISTVYSTIGDGETLDEVKFNGVSSENTVNENIAGINGIIGDFSKLENKFDNLTNHEKEVEAQTVVEAFDNIDATFGRIHGLFDGSKVNTSEGALASTTGSHSNLAQGTTVEMHLVSLDNAIGDRSTITNEKAFEGANRYDLVARTNVADVLSDIASQIGTADHLADTTIKSIDAGQTVNQNIAALNNAIGDVSLLAENLYASGDNLVEAVQHVDDKLINLDGRMTQAEKDLKELHHDFRRGMASMAAMSALVPNSRSTGKTSLSIGTGAYSGHNAVAVGGFHYITDNLMLNAGLSWSDSSDAAYRMGVTYSF